MALYSFNNNILVIHKIISIVIILALIFSVVPFIKPFQVNAADSNWEWQNPLPQGNNFRDVWGSSGNNVFTVGAAGTILHYNGASWGTMVSSTSNDLYGIWGSSSTDVFAVGQYGTILHYNGVSWSTITVPASYSRNHLKKIWGSSSNDIFVTGSNGTILHYDGATWSTMVSSTSNELRSIWGSSSNDIFVTGSNGTILHYNGTTWSTMVSGTSEYLTDIWGSSSSDVFVTGYGGIILHYNGTTWSTMVSGNSNGFIGLWGITNNDVFAISDWRDGDNVGCRLFHYDGSNWTPGAIWLTKFPRCVSGNTYLYALWGSSSNDIFAVGYIGAIIHYDGTAWSTMNPASMVNKEWLTDIWGSSSSDVFVVGDNTILHYNGTIWSDMTPTGIMTPRWLLGIWGSSSSDVFAVGEYGTILHYNGSSWTTMTSGASNTLRNIWGSSSSDVFAVGSEGILHYNGTTWSNVYSGGFSDIWGTSSTDVFAVNGQGVFHYNGSTWSNIYSGTFSHIWGSSNNDIFVVSNNKNIIHYNGSNWSPIPIGAIEQIDNIWGSSSTDVFAVSGYGTIFHYDGAIWRTMFGGTDNLLHALWGSSSSDVFAAGFAGNILHYNGAPKAFVPSITSINPQYDYQGQTLNIVITGSYFTGAIAVSFGPDITVNNFNINSDTQITANITIDCDAQYRTEVTVITSAGPGKYWGFDSYYGKPIITAVNPNTGYQGQTLNNIIITGNFFTGATAVNFGNGITTDSFTTNNSTQITANITIAANADEGTRNISVTAPNGIGYLPGGFIVNQTAPTVTTITPNTGNQGQTLSSVVITGTNFIGASAVSFGSGITTNSFSVGYSARMTANITIEVDATLGTRDVSVTTASGTGTITNGFTITTASMPTITTVTPNSGIRGEQFSQQLSVIVTGTNFTGATAVSFGTGITINHSTIDSNTQISAIITIAANATIGTRTVSVTTPSGTGTLLNGFTVTVGIPTITNVSPNFANQGQTLSSVIITGTHLIETTSVSFGNDITTNNFTIESHTQITANITIGASSTTGSRTVSVTSPGGTGTLPNGFTIYSASQPPESPSLSYPANTTTVSGTTITFQWNASTGATGYWLSVTKISDGSIVISQYVGNVTSFIQGGFPNNGTQYRWAVAAGNSTGWSSGTSATFNNGAPAVAPPAPTLISPANTTTVSGTTITFQWNASTGATGYWLSVTKISDGSSLISQYVGNVTSFNQGGFPNNGTQYRWAVAAGNSSGWSSGTSATFTNGTPAVTPPAPTLISPANTTTVSGTTITFQWNASTGATGYWLSVTKISDGSSLISQYVGNVTSFNQGGFPNNGTQYRWAVAAGNSTGWSSGTSATFNNGAPAVAPPAPTLISPANTGTVSGTTITFQWNASTGATGYWLSVTKASDGSVLFSQYIGNVISYSVGGFPDNGTQYRWAVAAGNSSGWSSGTSATFTNGTPAVTPPAPTLISPGNTTIVGGTSINFQWNASTGATGYWLSATKVSDGSVLFSQYVGNVISYSVGGFPDNGTQYRWAVAAGNSSGWSSGTSATFTNGTPAVTPPAPTLISPGNTTIVGGTSINFQWNASTGATGYWLSATKVSDGSVLFSQYVGNVISYSVAGFPNNGTQYRWAVAAGNSTGWSSGTSATFTNGTPAVTPPAPTLISPGNTTIVGGTSINFQWNASSGATGYWLSATKVSDGSVLFSQYVGNVISYSVGGFPDNGTQYRWAVAAGNSSGWSSGTSATFTNGP